MTEKIHHLLRQLEEEHHMEILYACESGSRAWGFASPDSDYDIRFLYRKPMAETYLVEQLADTIECPIEEDLDPGGWDIRKALGLLRKSNGALIEWLHSPIVYHRNQEFHQEFQMLCRTQLSTKGLSNHYRGLAKGAYASRVDIPEPTAKGYLYCLRAVLCARHILDTGSPPPVPFTELIDLAPPKTASAIRKLVAWKAEASENASPGKILTIDQFLKDSLSQLSCEIEELPMEEIPTGPFDDALNKWTLWPKEDSRLTIRKADFTLSRVRERDFLLFECVCGSRAFGTYHEHSDHDLRGVFVAPTSFLCSLESIDQISDEKSDEVYYELNRFFSLLEGNNPNLIELLFTPEELIRYKHPAFDLIKPDIFLSKLCRQSFGNYAMGQIRKARGLNKKIVNPEPEKRRHLRHFCHILEGQGSRSLKDWLKENDISEQKCGLVAAKNAPGMYALFYDVQNTLNYRGLFTRKDDAAIICSSVPKGAEPIAWMHCNLDAFKAHCRTHREYWEWVEKRNEERYETNTSHGQGYDSKNLMHTLRLLEQGVEIAKEGRITLPRQNAEWLKKIKSGMYTYEELLEIAEERHQAMEEAFTSCSLAERPSREIVTDLLLEVRSTFSKTRSHRSS